VPPRTEDVQKTIFTVILTCIWHLLSGHLYLLGV